MILGVDHVAVTATAIEKGVDALKEQGYLPKFVDHDVPNPETKRPLLRQYRPEHDIAYCQRSGTVAMELTMHGESSTNGAHPGFVPVFEGAFPVEVIEEHPWLGRLRASLGDSLRLGRNTTLAAPVGVIPGDDPARLHTLVVPTPDLALSTEFWTSALRARAGEAGEGWARGNFVSPVKTWSLPLVFLQTADASGPSYLDDSGFRCLALLSTSFVEDLERVSGAGATDVACFTILVGGRTLEAAIFRTPDGNIAEILQIPERE